ncbi:hypothetical protein [Yoonia sp. 2307UL14-13]|uniref:hypothetical protein n=1 Tax=Yoonia sp. 2307UL14-13 TaxID=3126506 RepID=UPI003095D18D
MRIITTLALITLTACSNESLINSAYPDRERISFASSDGIDTFTYLCEPGSTPAETQSRAQEAHRFVEVNLDVASERAAEQLISDVEEDRSRLGSSIRLATAMNRAAELIAEQTDERYQCLLIDTGDS